MQTGEHMKIHFILGDNAYSQLEGVLENAGPEMVEFLSIEDGKHFYVPYSSIKYLESQEFGPSETDPDDAEELDVDDLPEICEHCGAEI